MNLALLETPKTGFHASRPICLLDCDISRSCLSSRLTAEDIRRQHPRAVANQLETLKLQNEHLEAQVRSLEHEREKLKTSVKDSKASLRKAEKHITDVESAQDQERNKIWVSFTPPGRHIGVCY